MPARGSFEDRSVIADTMKKRYSALYTLALPDSSATKETELIDAMLRAYGWKESRAGEIHCRFARGPEP